MIQLETPGITRGVVALPPPGWSENPTFVSTLLNGLQGHPLLASVNVSSVRWSAGGADRAPAGLFSGFSAGTSAATGPGSSTGSSTTAVPTTPTAGPAPSPSLAGDAGRFGPPGSRRPATSTILPTTRRWRQPSSSRYSCRSPADITEGQRQALLGSVAKNSGRVFGQISLPGSSSITLTSTKAQIPLTILLKRPLKAHVELQLTSQRLLFQPFVPPNGQVHGPDAHQRGLPAGAEQREHHPQDPGADPIVGGFSTGRHLEVARRLGGAGK